MKPDELAKANRQIKAARTLRELQRGSGTDFNLGGFALSASPVPPGVVPPGVPKAPNDVVKVIGEIEANPNGQTWMIFTNTQSPPARRGFENLALPSTAIPVGHTALYTTLLEVEWEGQGGIAEVWAGGNRINVQYGRSINTTIPLGVVQVGDPISVRVRPDGPAAKVRVALTIQVGAAEDTPRDLLDFDPSDPGLPAPPPAPEAPSLTAGTELNNAWIEVTWAAVLEAVRYDVRAIRDSDGHTVVQAVDSTATSTRIEWLDPLTTYLVSVWAYDFHGQMSLISPEVSITTPADESIPDKVTGLTASAGLRTVTLQWEGNQEADVANGYGSYVVELSTSNTFTSPIVQETGALIASFMDLAGNQTYYGRVRAKDRSQNLGEWSDTVQIATGSVLSADLANLSITTEKLADELITNQKLLDGAVGTTKIQDGSIITDKINTGAITTDKLGANSVVANKIQSNAVIADKIAANAVTAAKIQAGQINSDHIITAGLDAATIKFGTMNGDRISANSMDVNRLTSSTLTSRTITIGSGGNLQVQGVSSARLLIDSTGMRLFNTSGQITMQLSASNGSASFSGNVTSSATITGSALSGTTIDGGIITGSIIRTSTSGARVLINGNTDRIIFYNSSGQNTSIYQGNSTGLELSSSLRLGGSSGNGSLYSGYQYVGNFTSLAMATNQVGVGAHGIIGYLMAKVGTNAEAALYLRRDSNGLMARFYHGHSNVRAYVGGISINSSSTAFHTSSDYRLKKNVATLPVAEAIGRVMAARPVAFKWKNNDESDVGYIAHELDGVMPQAVVGAKDAVDSQGNPDYQGVDSGKLIPDLHRTVQYLLGERDQIISRLEELEGAT